MTDLIKQRAPEILETIKGANKILMHNHPNPDPDSVGSSLALMHVFKSMGKDVVVIAGDSEKPRSMSHLPGDDQIIPKDFFEIDLGEFDLFIILDSSKEDMISQKGVVSFPAGLKKVVIDHHDSNRGFGDINLVDSSYSATCEIVYDLIKEWKVEITPEIAECLLLGIYFDSGGFAYDRVTSETFERAAELSKIYPSLSETIFKFENNNSPGRLKFLGLAYSSIEIHGKMAISSVSLEAIKRQGIGRQDMENTDIANMLKSVEGWDIGASLIEKEENFVNVSLRTRDSEKYDLSKITSELGGGGHRAAAGATVNKPLPEAKELLIETVQRLYPDVKD